jgi:hypothetical protein
MAEVAAVAEKVRQHWLSQGLRVSPVKPEELEALRRSRPDRIPEDYEAFLRIAGLPEDEDGEGFRFWLPNEVRATHDVLGEARYASDAVEPSVIIADYLQESWWYALWLAGPFRGHVSLVLGHADGRDPQPPLGTFVDFLLAYLNDEARLYPPASSPEHAGHAS